MEERRPTKRMLEATKFCEFWLEVKFKGDRNSFSQVSGFLSQHLEEAKAQATADEEEASFNMDLVL